MEEPRGHQHVGDQPLIDTTVGWCPGESHKLRRTDNIGLARNKVRWCIVQERIHAANVMAKTTVTARRSFPSPASQNKCAWSGATTVASSVSENEPRDRVGFNLISLPGLGNSAPGEERPQPLQLSPMELKHSPPGEEWSLALQNVCTYPEPGLWEPAALARVKSPIIVRVQLALSAKVFSGLERLPPEDERLPPSGL